MAAPRTLKVTRIIHWVTRIIALLFTLCVFLGLPMDSIHEIVVFHTPVTAETIFPIVFGIFILIACLVSWWREVIGGWLFIAASVFSLVGPLVWGDSNDRFYSPYFFSNLLRHWLELGLPLLIIAISFLVTSSLSRKKTISPEIKSGTMADIHI